jgi:transposase InsO family protein
MLNQPQRHRHMGLLIEAGKPNQSAYVESFIGRLRDECLNEHCFVSLAHARAVIEAWRQEYNDERPKKSLGGLTPAQYARALAKADYNAGNSKQACY